MSCSKVNQGGENPWNTRGVAISATVAVIIMVVCAVLATLVSQNLLTFPAQITFTNLLVGGALGGLFFGLISLAIRYCCCKKSAESDTPKDLKSSSEESMNLEPTTDNSTE